METILHATANALLAAGLFVCLAVAATLFAVGALRWAADILTGE